MFMFQMGGGGILQKSLDAQRVSVHWAGGGGEEIKEPYTGSILQKKSLLNRDKCHRKIRI